MNKPNLNAMKKLELMKLADDLGLDVQGDWKIDTLRRKIAERQQIIGDEEARQEVPEETMTVRLLVNHRPAGWYEIVGHEEDGVLIDGAAPHNAWQQEHKISAGTILKLPQVHGAKLVNNIVEELRTERDEDGTSTGRKRKYRVRVPLAEVYVPMAATGLVDQRAA